MGGPQAFRVEVIQALRSLLENERSRATLLEVLRSESVDEALDKTEDIFTSLSCTKTCHYLLDCNYPIDRPITVLRKRVTENCYFETDPIPVNPK